ncbi:MAG: hypothetical protein WD317_06385 [Balneolaceae bacterium]
MSRKRNLTDHIKEVLREHEEPYQLGSWEHFRDHEGRKEKYSAGKKAFGIAASVLLATGLLFFAWNYADSPESGQLALEEPVNSPGMTGIPKMDDPAPPEEEQALPDEEEGTRFPAPLNERDEERVAEDGSGREIPDTGATDMTDVTDSFTPSPVPVKSFEGQRTATESLLAGFGPDQAEPDSITARLPRIPSSGSSVAGPLSSGSGEKVVQRLSTAGRGRGKEIEFSVAYAPVMNVHNAQTDISIGGGFYTDWSISDNLSLSSGVFISGNRLRYSDNPERRMGEMMSAGSRPLDSAEGEVHMQVDLLGMELPMNLRYFITDNVFLSGGISSVIFLKEQFEYTYEYQQRIQVMSSEGTGAPVTRTVTMTDSRTQSEPSLNGMNWAAFYTISAGYHYDIANRHTVALEPFVKIPTGRLTTRDIRYTTGGVQMKIFF